MKQLFIGLWVTLVLASCNGRDTGSVQADSIAMVQAKKAQATQAATDDKLIKQYIATNNIPAQKDSSGVYYQILKEGAGANPTLSSTLNLTYKGQLLNGTVFDQSQTPITMALRDFIPGWQIGLRHIKAGGKILLIIPSALAYGPDSPSEKIPANSVMLFTVELFYIR